MAVLVVGGAGYVGQFVIRELLAQGRDVHITHRPGKEPPPGLPSEVRRHALDLAAIGDPESTSEASVAARSSLEALLCEVDPVAVINCAAISGLGPCEKDPVAAAAVNCPRSLVHEVAKQAARAPRLFVHFSTDIVFDGDPSRIYTEESVPTPVNAYGRMKAEFDAFLSKQTEPTCVVLRPTNIVGPAHPYAVTGGKFLQWLDGRLRADEPSKLFEDEFRNYVWVEDLVAVVMRLISDFPTTLPPHRLFHCGGPESLSRVQVAHALASAKGYALTFKDADGKEQQRVVPSPRASVDLGYPSPLCVRFASAPVESYLGRPFRRLSEWLELRASRV